MVLPMPSSYSLCFVEALEHFLQSAGSNSYRPSPWFQFFHVGAGSEKVCPTLRRHTPRKLSMLLTRLLSNGAATRQLPSLSVDGVYFGETKESSVFQMTKRSGTGGSRTWMTPIPPGLTSPFRGLLTLNAVQHGITSSRLRLISFPHDTHTPKLYNCWRLNPLNRQHTVFHLVTILLCAGETPLQVPAGVFPAASSIAVVASCPFKSLKPGDYISQGCNGRSSAQPVVRIMWGTFGAYLFRRTTGTRIATNHEDLKASNHGPGNAQ